MRELNLASSNFYGSFANDPEHAFHVDSEASEEHPLDALWVHFAYECASCGELLAGAAMASAARGLGLRACIFMPVATPAAKVDRVLRYVAEVVLNRRGQRGRARRRRPERSTCLPSTTCSSSPPR